MNEKNAPSAIDQLLDVMARLRDPDNGCPWDLEQTFESIVPYTIEEAWEVADAVQKGDMQHFKEELGDLLLQVVFQAQMANEQGLFSFYDVAQVIIDKLIRRHPHVFPANDQHVNPTITADDVSDQWEAIKQQEKQGSGEGDHRAPSALDGIAAGLPPTLRALKLQKKAAKVNFDWNDTRQVLRQLRYEIVEFEESLDADDRAGMEDELGDVMFSIINLARHIDVDAEQALLKCNHKFETRFKTMERIAPKPLEHYTVDEQEILWCQAKDWLAAEQQGVTPVPKNELKFQLQKLHETLQGMDSVDDEARQSLQTLSADIDGVLNGEGRADDNSLIETIERESVKFSIDHPALSGILNELVAVLGRMGI